MFVMREEYTEGQIIAVKSSFFDGNYRDVVYENFGIRVKEFWFNWDYFFKVNVIVK